MDGMSLFLLFLLAMFLLTGWSWWACTSPNASKSQREFGEFVIGTSWPLALILAAKRSADHIIESKHESKEADEEANR
jgi:hypothetical protein